jgi:hypothetical protein
MSPSNRYPFKHPPQRSRRVLSVPPSICCSRGLQAHGQEGRPTLGSPRPHGWSLLGSGGKLARRRSRQHDMGLTWDPDCRGGLPTLGRPSELCCRRAAARLGDGQRRRRGQRSGGGLNGGRRSERRGGWRREQRGRGSSLWCGRRGRGSSDERGSGRSHEWSGRRGSGQRGRQSSRRQCGRSRRRGRSGSGRRCSWWGGM